MLNSLIESDVGISPTIYEITISDASGVALVSSDASLRDQPVPKRPPVSSLVRGGFFRQIGDLYGPPKLSSFPFRSKWGHSRLATFVSAFHLHSHPGTGFAGTAFGRLLGSCSVLICTVFAFLVSTVALAPIERISAQLDRISAGQFDPNLLSSGAMNSES